MEVGAATVGTDVVTRIPEPQTALTRIAAKSECGIHVGTAGWMLLGHGSLPPTYVTFALVPSPTVDQLPANHCCTVATLPEFQHLLYKDAEGKFIT